MFAIIGILVVIGAVMGGFLMEHGPVRVLIQPAEMIIILGAALGTLVAANPLHTLKGVMGGVLQVLKGSQFNKKRYLDALKMMYDLFNKIRREGPSSVESDIEAPEKSKFFASFPSFLKDHESQHFVCDTMRVVLMGGVEPFDMDQMIEADMEVHSNSLEQSVTALSTVADSLPGLGIVAAVLGVVMTMSALGGPPEEIGKKVAAALVGTFLGILMCYGFIGPISSNLSKLSHEEHEYQHVLRVTMIAFMKGISPLLAVEMGRRAVPGHLRPTFDEFEKACKQAAGAAAPAAEGAAASPLGLPHRKSMGAANQIIVIKRKSGHGGHHGGAWKVAYADFVTAMMALFIVLWLMNTSKPIQEAISGYFKDPAGNGKLTGTKEAGPKQPLTASKENMAKLKEELQKAMQQVADFDKLKNHIEMTLTPEGLRIELMESEKGTFFDSGSHDPNGDGRELLMTIAEELGKLPNKLSIEGHTDSQPFSGAANYTNWELSTDRANASRRLMQQHGLRSDQVAQVRGFADQQPRNAKEASDPSNRRISVIVQYLDKQPPGSIENLDKNLPAPAAGSEAQPAPERSGEKKKP